MAPTPLFYHFQQPLVIDVMAWQGALASFVINLELGLGSAVVAPETENAIVRVVAVCIASRLDRGYPVELSEFDCSCWFLATSVACLKSVEFVAVGFVDSLEIVPKETTKLDRLC